MNTLYSIYLKPQKKCIAIVDNKDLADFIVSFYPVPCGIDKTETEITLKDLDNYILFK